MSLRQPRWWQVTLFCVVVTLGAIAAGVAAFASLSGNATQDNIDCGRKVNAEYQSLRDDISYQLASAALARYDDPQAPIKTYAKFVRADLTDLRALGNQADRTTEMCG